MQSMNIKNFLTQAHSNEVLKLEDSNIYSSNIGKLGIFTEQIDHLIPQFEEVFHTLQKTPSDAKYFKILHQVDAEAEYEKVIKTANLIRAKFKKIVVLAMGGSTLNPQSIVNLMIDKRDREIEFVTTTDPVKLKRTAKSISLEDTAFIVISNSGETIEVIAQLEYFSSFYKDAKICDHFFFVVGESKNTIHSFALKHGCKIIAFDSDVSGRFSTFTTCTTLIIESVGLSSKEFINGANSLKNEFWKNPFSSLPFKSACYLHLLNLPISVILSYTQDSCSLIEWYAQIIGESLGKEKRGVTPIRGVGPEDQHSQLQLYIEGIRNKSFTFIKFNDDESFQENKKLELLGNKKVNEVHDAFYLATYESLLSLKLPVRKIEIHKRDEFSIGYLMMLMTFEVVLCGMLMKINPFNQEGVELIKVRARKKLGL